MTYADELDRQIAFTEATQERVAIMEQRHTKAHYRWMEKQLKRSMWNSVLAPYAMRFVAARIAYEHNGEPDRRPDLADKVYRDLYRVMAQMKRVGRAMNKASVESTGMVLADFLWLRDYEESE